MREKSPKIKHAVILVNYKGWQDTMTCINSIKKSKDAPHIIVVDNGSPDDSVAQLTARVKELDLIESKDNLGFSGGNNLGIQKALKMGAQVVYILNNDTSVDPNLFFRSYRYVVEKNRIAGGKIYYDRGYEFHAAQIGQGNILWYAGGFFDWTTVIARHAGVDELDHGQYDKIQSVDFITGCFMAIPRKVFKKIGLFDESFFLYLEDVDLCLHAQRAKIELMYNPKLILYHRNSSTTISGSLLTDYYLTRNRFLIAKRYGSLRLNFAMLREALSRNLKSAIRRRAFFDYLTGKMGNRNEKILH